MTPTNLKKVLDKAAKAALFTWQQNQDGVDDLVNDLWVWCLESPSAQEKLEQSDEFLARRIAYKAALRILARNALSDDQFSGRCIYSTDAVKAALNQRSTNKYLLDILPLAMRSLGSRNQAHADAIRSRYDDLEVPTKEGGDAMLLSRAVKSLTQHVNIIALTAGVDSDGSTRQGPGSRAAVFPETRRPKAGPADPTGNMAVMLIERPHLRDEYLQEETLQEFLEGRGYG